MSGTPMSAPPPRARRALAAALLASTALAGIPAASVRAQDATWLTAPGSGDMTDGLNWSSGALPTGTATFGPSGITNLTLGTSASFAGWTFASGAPTYAITLSAGSHQFTGPGIVVNGAIPTLTNNALIQFFNASSTGSAAITNNRSMFFYDTASAGSAVIANHLMMQLSSSSTLGSATVSGTGIIYFYGSSTAGSATITGGGTREFYDNSTAGSAIITNGSLGFRHNSTAGSAIISGGGSVNFYDTASAGSATITNIAPLNFSGRSTAGSATIANNGTLTFNDISSGGLATITNNLNMYFRDRSDGRFATITNNRDMHFLDSSSAGGAIITNADTLSFNGSSSAGGALINNANVLSFYGSSSAWLALITNNSFMQFQNSSSAGAARIINNEYLQFLDNSSAGSATIINNDRLFFYGDSGTGNATIFSAGSTILATTNMVGAAIITVESGGLLTGSGGVGDTYIQSSATFAPLGGTLAVNGNLILQAGSIYSFYAGGSAVVSGTATLGGASLRLFLPTSFQTQTRTLLTAAGGVTGTFTLDPAYSSSASVLYGTNDVTVTTQGYRGAAALSGTGTINARNVAAGIDRNLNSAGTPPPAAFNPLLGLYGTSLAAALNGVTGESATGAQSTAFSTASTFLGIMLDPMAGARGATAAAPGSSLIEMADTGMTPAARVAAGWSVWTKSFGQAGRSASDAGTGAAGTATSVFGVAAGADRRISPDTLVGFALAGGGTAFGLGGRGSGTGEYMQLGLYGSTRLGEGYLSAAIAYGWNRFDVTRRAGLGPIETYNSAPVAHTFGGRVETGRRFGNRAFALTPYAAVEAIGYASGAYNETFRPPATGAFALAYGARTTGTVRTEVGLRVDGMRAVAPTADLLTFGRIAYAFQANTQRAADASFQQLANSGFTVFGARASTHTMLATLGTEVRLAAGTRATASLDGELGDRHRSIRANLGLSHSW